MASQVIVEVLAVILFFPGLVASEVPLFQYGDPSCGGRQVLVQLFHWRWRNVAKECEEFLGPWGFCGVQVSVPTEHVVLSSPSNPWWQHYQPVSYKLESRFGTEEEFEDMVVRCSASGVRIFADIVLNNMAQLNLSGEGYNGTYFNSNSFHFPGVHFDKMDFNDPAVKCPSADGLVHDVTNPSEVRNCCYDSLTDLDQSQEAVQDVVVAYLNHLIDIGVAGFRVDKATFMWPKDLAAIQEKVKDRWSGGRPFYMLHVQDLTQGSVTWDEYDDLGYVTEFHYRQLVAEAMADSFEIVHNITSQSAGATLAPSARALVFLDNHETQRRGQQVASATHPWLTFRDAGKYTLATAFMLAYDYGFVRIMSSYNFSDVNEGPPTQPDGSIKDVVINDDGACEGGWVCEHRWPTIATLVRFRTAVAGADVNHWYAPHGLVAFSRGSVGFFAMTVTMSYVTKVMTGLPPGTYCELVSSCLSTLTVDEEGYISLQLDATNNPVVTILTDMKVEVATKSSVDHTDAWGDLTYSSSGVTGGQAVSEQHASSPDTTRFQDITGRHESTAGVEGITKHVSTPLTSYFKAISEQQTSSLETTGFQLTTQQKVSTQETKIKGVTEQQISTSDATQFQVITDQPTPASFATGFQLTTEHPASTSDTTEFQFFTEQKMSTQGSTEFEIISKQHVPSFYTTGLQPLTGGLTLDTNGLQPVTGGFTSDRTGLQLITGGPTSDRTGLQPLTGGLTSDTNGLQPVTGGLTSHTNGLQPLTGGLASDRTGLQPLTGGLTSDTNGLQPVTGGFTSDRTGLQPVTGGFTSDTTRLDLVTGKPDLGLTTGLQLTVGEPKESPSTTELQGVTQDFMATSTREGDMVTYDKLSLPPSTKNSPTVTEARPQSVAPSSSSTTTTAPPTSSGYRRTVILLHWITSPAQYVFFRGGVDANHRAGCVSDTKVDPCAIPIRDREEVVNQYFQKYNAWRLGDDFLDWYGAEQGQGTFLGNVAEGSPGIWTSNNPADPGYQPINTFGNHYWMLDIDMDCSRTLENGYFELKAYSGHWEPNIATHVCAGSYPPVPYTSTNHFARCGYLNVFKQGGECEVRPLADAAP